MTADPTGPDPALADPPAVALYRTALAGVHVHEFPITALDHTGVPVWVAAAWLDGELTSGIGYGETDGRARVGAWGELVEGVFVHRLRSLPARRATYRALADAGEPAVDPRRLRLPIGTDYTDETERLWVQARRFAPGDARDGEPVWVLLDEAVAHTYNLPDGYRPLYTPITNGLGAGETLERAVGHGLLELVQRDGNSVGYRALDRGVVVDLDDVQDAETRRWLGRFAEAGIALMVKLADTPFGMADVYVEGREADLDRLPHPMALTGCGEAAHPDRERALRKALLEYGASRVRKRFAHSRLEDIEAYLPADYVAAVRAHPPGVEESRSLEAVREWSRVPALEALRRLDGTWFRDCRHVPFSSLPTSDVADEPAALAAEVASRMAEAGLDVLVVEVSPPGAPVRVVKVVVPGLEVETMTYGRIGPRNIRRLLDRIADGDRIVHPDIVGLGRPPAEAQAVVMAPDDEAALGGPAWARLDLLEEALGPLYAMYREPPEHAVSFADARDAAGERDAAA